jgi:hypothetical protein
VSYICPVPCIFLAAVVGAGAIASSIVGRDRARVVIDRSASSKQLLASSLYDSMWLCDGMSRVRAVGLNRDPCSSRQGDA